MPTCLLQVGIFVYFGSKDGMMKQNLFALFFAGISLIACSNSENAFSEGESSQSGFLDDSLAQSRELYFIGANNSSVELGTNSPEANVNERPAMKVKFNYDFYVSRHEITCSEFNSLMKPATGLSVECENKSHPAVNLTYYDAVLFANERSKKEGLDTAYTYLSQSFDAERHCRNLEGFEYHPDVESYRLPTEAEWVLAAKKNWRKDNAWTADNSDYMLHTVCSKSKSGELCDMMGNAMEWVNDWFGLFRDTTVYNYVGAPDGGALAQRIVKGGSFRNMAETISLYSRGDVYTVTSSTKSDYVGFRLAFGKIPDAAWMGSDGRAVSSRVTPLANSSSVFGHTKTYKSKLVFRNEASGNLAYIDYSSGILTVNEIVSSLDAYHPEISPDGKRVAFCTKYEGIDGTSELYVRDLNEEGSNLVKLDVESAAIPRWRVLDNGDTVIVYVTDAGNNKEESSFKSTSTWQVKFSKGKFGKPEKLFDGAYHGGITNDNSLAVSGARLLRARVNDRDTVWYNGEQACNVSLSKDSTHQTLFLDFGSATGRAFVGKKYATHQRIFVADSTGKLIHSVEAPAGYTFDHSEWGLGSSNIAVATLTNSNGAHPEIVLVDMSKGEILSLAKGDELWHPSFWFDNSASNSATESLDLDSAGVYMTETSVINVWIMKVKMDIFWQYRDSADAVIIGSSRAFGGVDPEAIKSHFAINMAYSAEDLTATLFFIENYILPLMPKLKTIVLALDYDRWYVKEEWFTSWFADIPGYEYDKHHGYWKDGLIGDMAAASRNALSPSPDEYNWYSYNRGLYYSTTVGWGNDDSPAIENDVMWFEHDNSGMQFNLYVLNKILEFSQNFGVKVVGVVFPQSPNYKKTDSWGRYGPTRNAVKIMEEAVDKLTDTYPNFTVWDANLNGNHDYTYEDFANDDHLSRTGAVKLSTRLDSLLKKLDK